MEAKKTTPRAPYPQTVRHVVFNEGQVTDQDRKCTGCGVGSSLFPLGKPIFFVHQPSRKRKCKLEKREAYCYKGCVQLAYEQQRGEIESASGGAFLSYWREVHQVKVLSQPAPPLYEHEHFAWIPIYGKSLSPTDYISHGRRLAQNYLQEEKTHQISEAAMWSYICKFRQDTEKLPVSAPTHTSEKPNSKPRPVPPKLPRLQRVQVQPTFEERDAQWTANQHAELVRTQVEKSALLQTEVTQETLGIATRACAGLPWWMKWVFIDYFCGKVEDAKHFDWFHQWMKSTQDAPEFQTSYRLWQEWKVFIPKYTNDEWAQICPDEKAWTRYRKMVLGQSSMCCYACKQPIQGHPVFRVIAPYPPLDHVVFDTRMGYCSGPCLRRYLFDWKECRQGEELLYLEDLLRTRWYYPFQVQCAPPVALLPPYGNIRMVKNDDEEDHKHTTQTELSTLFRMLRCENFDPPQTVEEFKLCISMNFTVFYFLFPPMTAGKMYLYPDLARIFPYSLHRSGPKAKHQVGPIQEEPLDDV